MKKLDGALVGFRIVWYVACVMIIPALAAALGSAFLSFVVGGALAIASVAAETLFTAKIRQKTFSSVVVARLLIVDHIAAGEDQSVLAEKRKLLASGQKSSAGALEPGEKEPDQS